MKLTAYPLYNYAVPLQPAAEQRAWITENEAASAGLALNSASGKGWVLCCPYAFEATWNGGPASEDIDIQIDAMDGDAPAFVQSNLGDGLLTFYPGYQVQTEESTGLWVRGPINRPKDGLYALEQIVDTSLLPATITINWQCTRPNQTVRFAAGEPFCALVPYPNHYAEQFACDVVELDDDGALLEQALQQLLQTPDLQAVFQRLQQAAAPAEPQPADRSKSAAAYRKELAAPPKNQFTDQLMVPPQVALTAEYWIKEISGWPEDVTKYMQLHYLFLTAGDTARAEEALRQATECLPSMRTEKSQRLTAGSTSVDTLTDTEIQSIKGLEKLGSAYGGWIIPTLDISEDAVCYLAGVGEDITFDLALIARFNCSVFAFDPTARAKLHVHQHAADLSQFHFFDFGLWDAEGMLKFYAPANAEHVSHSIVNLQNSDGYFEAPCKRLSVIMREMGHSRIQLLKLDIEGAEYRVIDSLVEDRLDIGIICVEYHAIHNDADEFPGQIKKSVARLCEIGYALVAVEPNLNYTFVKETFLSHRN